MSNNKKYFLVFLFLISILLIGNLFKSNDSTEQNKVISSVKDDLQEANIVIDIQGAIKKPGIYTVSTSTRLFELIEKAGGLADNYDKDYYSKNINPSVKLKDQQKIYIPTTSDKYVEELVNINSANVDILINKLGITSANAKKIVGDRPYSDISELLTKGILSSKVYSQISNKIRI